MIMGLLIPLPVKQWYIPLRLSKVQFSCDYVISSVQWEQVGREYMKTIPYYLQVAIMKRWLVDRNWLQEAYQSLCLYLLT